MTPNRIDEAAFAAAAVLMTLLVALLLYRLLIKGLHELVRATNLPPVTHRRLVRVIRWVVFGMTFFMALQHTGMRNAWAVVSAMLAAIAVGFVAVWSVLSNVICAVMILIYRPFRIGDHIELLEVTGGTGHKGRVADLNLMFTTLVQSNDDKPDVGEVEIRVPNNIFFQKLVRRWPSGDAPRDTFFESGSKPAS